MSTVAFIVAMVVMVTACLRYASWRDARFRIRNCQVCAGLGSVALTDIDPGRFLCLEHRESAARIMRLESELFG